LNYFINTLNGETQLMKKLLLLGVVILGIMTSCEKDEKDETPKGTNGVVFTGYGGSGQAYQMKWENCECYIIPYGKSEFEKTEDGYCEHWYTNPCK
jgi:hypothetical protein